MDFEQPYSKEVLFYMITFIGTTKSNMFCLYGLYISSASLNPLALLLPHALWQETDFYGM